MYKSLETVTGTPTRLSMASPPPPSSSTSTSSTVMEQVADQVRKQLLFDEEVEEEEVPQKVTEDHPLAEPLAEVEEVISSTTTPEETLMKRNASLQRQQLRPLRPSILKLRKILLPW